MTFSGRFIGELEWGVTTGTLYGAGRITQAPSMEQVELHKSTTGLDLIDGLLHPHITQNLENIHI